MMKFETSMNLSPVHQMHQNCLRERRTEKVGWGGGGGEGLIILNSMWNK